MHILIPGAGLIWLYVSYGWVGILLLLVVLIVLFFIFISINNSSVNAEVEESKSIIKKHANELLIRKQQLSYDDGYGLTNTSKWEKEKKKFIKNIIRTSSYGKLSEEHLSFLIDDSLHSNSSFNKSYTSHKPSIESNASTHRVGSDYESACANLLSTSGWKANTTKATGDQGADIIADKNGKKVVIQCKNHSRPVGNKAVQEAHAAKAFYGASHAVVVSNNSFTVAAKQAANRLGVELVHHSELSSLDEKIK